MKRLKKKIYRQIKGFCRQSPKSVRLFKEKSKLIWHLAYKPLLLTTGFFFSILIISKLPAILTGAKTEVLSPLTLHESNQWEGASVESLLKEDNLYAYTHAKKSQLAVDLSDTVSCDFTVSSITINAYAYSAGNDQTISLGVFGDSTGEQEEPSHNEESFSLHTLRLEKRQDAKQWECKDLNDLVAIIRTHSGSGEGEWRIDKVWVQVEYTSNEPIINQRSYRWQYSTDKVSEGIEPDSDMKGVKIGTQLALRIQLDNTGGVDFSDTQYSLQYALKVGGDCGKGQNWQDVTDSTPISYTDTSKEKITTPQTDTTKSCGDGSCIGFIGGSWDTYSSSVYIPTDQFTELGFTLGTLNADLESKYCLRVVAREGEEMKELNGKYFSYPEVSFASKISREFNNELKAVKVPEVKVEKTDYLANESPIFELDYFELRDVTDPYIEGVIEEERVFEEGGFKIAADVLNNSGEKTEIVPQITLAPDGHTYIEIPTQNSFRPGKFSLKINVEERDYASFPLEQDFTWGVLAINTNKSIYTPNETVKFLMTVLDDNGRTVCDADVRLEVISPSGKKQNFSNANGTIINSSQCGPNNVTYVPDFYAQFEASEIGDFEMKMTAITPNGGRTLIDKFKVEESRDFDIERIGPVRIYPLADYEMKIFVKPNVEFTGKVIESVPSSFEIKAVSDLPDGQAGEQEAPAKGWSASGGESVKRITWDVDCKAGEMYELSYTFDAPDVSPEFYLLGPLEIEFSDPESSEIHKIVEARSWQIAGDSPGTKTKTVEFYIGQHTGTGTVAANTYWSNTFSVYLPDCISSSTAIKSAYIDFTFNNATTTAPGIVNQELKLSSEGTYDVVSSVSYLSSGENYVIRHRADFLSKLQSTIQASGTYTFNYRARIAGTTSRMLSAKITITYNYDDVATTQIKTVRYYGGQDTGDLAVSSTSQYSLSAPGLPEASVTIYDAWAEVTTTIVGTGTTDENISLWYDSDTATTVMVDNAGGAGGRPGYFLLRKIITDASHTFNIRPTAGYPLTLCGMEQVITYYFNYSSSSSLLKTHEVLMGSDGNKASTATLDWNKTINIPETSLTWKSIYIKGFAHSAADNANQLAAQLNSAPTPSTTFSFNYQNETYHNYWILSNETNNLNTMSNGNNAVYVRWQMSSGSATSRAASVVLTYIHAKSDTTTNSSAKFLVGQDTAYGTTYQPSFSVSIAGSTQNMTSFIMANSVNGATADSAAYISIQPTSTSTYNWNSTGEYQWVLFAHDNVSSEITGSGSYTANLNSGANNVMSAFVVVNWQYAVAPNLTQNHFRWRDDTYGLNTNNGWLASEDTYTTLAKSSTIRLRAEIANTGEVAASNYQYRLEYAARTGGTCGDETFTTVPVTATTEHFEMVTSGQYTDGDNTTSGFLTATGTWANGEGVEDPSNQTVSHSLTNAYYTEHEYAIQATSNATNGAYYCFRLTNAGSTTNFTYSLYPQVQMYGVVGSLGKSEDGWGGAIPVYMEAPGYGGSYYARAKVDTPASETYYTSMSWDSGDLRYEGTIYIGSWYCNGCVDPNTGSYSVTVQIDDDPNFGSINDSDSTSGFSTWITRRKSSKGTGTDYSDYNANWNTDHWDCELRDFVMYASSTKSNVAVPIPFYPTTATITNIAVSFNGSSVSQGSAESTSDAWWWVSSNHTLYVQNDSMGTSEVDVDISFDSDTDLMATRFDRVQTTDMGNREFYNGLLLNNQYWTTSVYGGGHEGAGEQAESRAHESTADNNTTDCMERVAVHVDDDETVCDSSGYYTCSIKWKQQQWANYITSQNNSQIVVVVDSDDTASTGWAQQLDNGISATRTQTFYAGERYIKNVYELTNNDSSSHKYPVVWEREQWLGGNQETGDEGRYDGDSSDVTLETRNQMTSYACPWHTSYDTGFYDAMGVIFDAEEIDSSTYGIFAADAFLTNTGGAEWPIVITNPHATQTADNTGFEHSFSSVAPDETVSFTFYQVNYDTTSWANVESAMDADCEELNPDVTVTSSGTQTSTMNIPSSNQYVGGMFVLTNNESGTETVTGITITEQGTVDADDDLSGIELYYETSSDCSGESYGGGESPFGSSTTFNSSDKASFSGSVGIGTGNEMCVYVVLDVDSTANDGDTLEIEIEDPQTEVVLSAGEVGPAHEDVEISGTTDLEGVTNTAPNSPTNLTQKQTDDTTIILADWTDETSVKFTATASDTDNPDTLYLCIEADQLGTAFSNTEDSCGSGVAYSGTPVEVTHTLSGLTQGQEYHWQARVKDEANAYSNWVSYPTPTANSESDRDFGVDTSAPSTGTVNDGGTIGSDIDENDGSLDEVEANWTDIVDAQSGVKQYQYAIGTTSGGEDILTWTTKTPPGNTFSGSFESGNLSAWDTNQNDGGDLSATANSSGGYIGLYGLSVNIDDGNSIYVEDDFSSANNYYARFYLNPNNLTMSSGDTFTVVDILSSSTVRASVELYYNGSNYQVRGVLETGPQTTSWVTIGATSWTSIEIRWFANASGYVSLWVDGDQYDTATDNTNGMTVDNIKMGMVSDWDSGTSGEFFIDQFTSDNADYNAPFTYFRETISTADHLHTGQDYHVSVRATNNVEITGGITNSDGFKVLPAFSLAIDPNSITFNELNLGNSWTDDTKTTTTTASTNAYHGYIATIWISDNLIHTQNPSYTISNYPDPNSAPTVWSGTGFGYTTNDSNLSGTGDPDRFTNGGPNYAGFVTSGEGYPCVDHTTLVTGTTGAVLSEQFTITYRVTVNATQAAGLYTTNIIYIATPIF